MMDLKKLYSLGKFHNFNRYKSSFKYLILVTMINFN